MSIYLNRFPLIQCLGFFIVIIIYGSIWNWEVAGAVEERPDANLIKEWGDFGGPVPKEFEQPAPPPSIPETCMVLKCIECGFGDPCVLVARYLQHMVPKANDQEHQSKALSLNWKPLKQSSPGVWRGDFDLAKFELKLKNDRIIFAWANGAERIIINGECYFGDPDRRGLHGVPIRLQKGSNEVILMGIRGGFEFGLWTPRTRMVMGTWDARIYEDGKVLSSPYKSTTSGSELFLPVFNASNTTAWGIHFHYGHAVSGWEGDIPCLTDWSDGGKAAPLCFAGKRAYLFDMDAEWAGTADKLKAPLCTYDYDDSDADRQVLKLDLRDEWPVYLDGGELPCRDLLLGSSSKSFIVYVTGEQSQNISESLACARYLQQMIWYEASRAPWVIADHELDDFAAWRPIEKDALVVIVGDASLFKRWKNLQCIDDPKILLPEDIASSKDAELGLRLVTPGAMPKCLPRPIALVHSRSATGMNLAALLDYCGDSRLSAPSVSVMLPEGDDASLRIENITR